MKKADLNSLCYEFLTVCKFGVKQRGSGEADKNYKQFI